jgi:hypothetical protein
MESKENPPAQIITPKLDWIVISPGKKFKD